MSAFLLTRLTLIWLLVFGCSYLALAQSHRLKFKYRMSQERLNRLNRNGYQLQDTCGNFYQLCPKNSKKFRFKFLISQDKYNLNIDPWAIKPTSDSCKGSCNVVNSETENSLLIKLKPRKHVGDPTFTTISIPYQSWIIGFNSISIKFRPSVKNWKDSTYAATVMAGVNLGISGGYSFGWTRFNHRGNNSWSITPNAAVGFSSQSLKDQPLSDNVVATAVGKLVISPSISCIFARNDIGLIVSYGWDLMTGKERKAWAYNGKGYFGLGIAAGLKL